MYVWSWETQPQSPRILEVRNFVLYGYYLQSSFAYTDVARRTSYTMLTVHGAVQSVACCLALTSKQLVAPLCVEWGEHQHRKQEKERQKREEAETMKNVVSTKETPKKKKSTDDQGLQGHEISSSECAAYFGLYEDDVNDEDDVTCDWIQCTN